MFRRRRSLLSVYRRRSIKPEGPDINHIQRPSLAAVGRIHANQSFVPAQPWMCVNTPLPNVFTRTLEPSKVDPFARSDFVGVRSLLSTRPLRIGVIQDPAVPSQVSQVPTRIKDAPPDLLHDSSSTVFKKEVTPTLISKPAFRLGQNVCGISPNEVWLCNESAAGRCSIVRLRYTPKFPAQKCLRGVREKAR